MYAWIGFNDQSPGGRLLRRMLSKNEQGDDEMADVLDLIVQMRDGADDPEDSANYAEVVRQFGFGGWVSGVPTAEQTDKAQACFNELSSAYSKTSGNGSVTNVRAARDQLYSKLRG
jgi:hypothetical protein